MYSHLAKKEKNIHILQQLNNQQNLVNSYHEKWSEAIQEEKMKDDDV